VTFFRFCLAALFCAACSAAPDDGALSDHGGELALDPPADLADPDTPSPPRVERSASATPIKPTPDPWRVASGVGKPTPDPWASWEECGAQAETPGKVECEQGQDGLAPGADAPPR
jgi:hypothetical protein